MHKGSIYSETFIAILDGSSSSSSSKILCLKAFFDLILCSFYDSRKSHEFSSQAFKLPNAGMSNIN